VHTYIYLFTKLIFIYNITAGESETEPESENIVGEYEAEQESDNAVGEYEAEQEKEAGAETEASGEEEEEDWVTKTEYEYKRPKQNSDPYGSSTDSSSIDSATLEWQVVKFTKNAVMLIAFIAMVSAGVYALRKFQNEGDYTSVPNNLNGGFDIPGFEMKGTYGNGRKNSNGGDIPITPDVIRIG